MYNRDKSKGNIHIPRQVIQTIFMEGYSYEQNAAKSL